MKQFFVGGLIGVLVATGVIYYFNPLGILTGVCVCQNHEGTKQWVMWPPGAPNPELCPPPGYNGAPCL